MKQKQSKPLVLCGKSRGVLQNARRVRRMAKINEAIINRAFCKTPLLASADFHLPASGFYGFCQNGVLLIA
ncbi:MAG: hypothetical protein ACI3X6_01935 [Alloprevotella sp.]